MISMQELQAAENRNFWITSSEGTLEKRPNYKGTLEASQPRNTMNKLLNYIAQVFFLFFQAEDGIRDRSPSRGLGDVYKRQLHNQPS